MTTFLELANKRQSTRRYKNQQVERDKINRCLEAARIAPSACNSQPWSFIVVDKEPLRKQIASYTYSEVISFNKFALQAPVIIVVVLERSKVIAEIGGRIKNKSYNLIDLGIAAEHFCLQATEEGLGTCMLGWFNEKKVKRALNIPDKKDIGLLISMGYPDDKARRKIRKDLEGIISYNTYI